MKLDLVTVGQIAERCKVPQYRVEYLLRDGKIEPAMRIGNIRLFTKQQADAIGYRLKQDNKRGRPLKKDN